MDAICTFTCLQDLELEYAAKLMSSHISCSVLDYCLTLFCTGYNAIKCNMGERVAVLGTKILQCCSATERRVNHCIAHDERYHSSLVS